MTILYPALFVTFLCLYHLGYCSSSSQTQRRIYGMSEWFIGSDCGEGVLSLYRRKFDVRDWLYKVRIYQSTHCDGYHASSSSPATSVSSSAFMTSSASRGEAMAHTPPPFPAPFMPTSFPTRFLPTLPGPRPTHLLTFSC